MTTVYSSSRGLYAALAVSERQTSTSYRSAPNVRYAPKEFDDQISYSPDTNNRRFDAGVNFGLGYRQGPVQVQASLGLGFVNLHRAITSNVPSFSSFAAYDFNKDAAYNRVAQLTGTYFFAL